MLSRVASCTNESFLDAHKIYFDPWCERMYLRAPMLCLAGCTGPEIATNASLPAEINAHNDQIVDLETVEL